MHPSLGLVSTVLLIFCQPLCFQDFLKLVFHYRGLVLGHMFLQFQHTHMGLQYMVFVQQQIASPATAIAVYGTLVNTSTSFTVFSKTTANALIDSNFYVYTVP